MPTQADLHRDDKAAAAQALAPLEFIAIESERRAGYVPENRRTGWTSTVTAGATTLAEVVTKLREGSLSIEKVEEVLGGLHLDVRPLTPMPVPPARSVVPLWQCPITMLRQKQ